MRWLAGVCVLSVGLVACDEVPPPGSSFFDERIQPVLEVGCAIQTNGCHVDVDGAATGNLDLSSFDALMRRRDVLPAYGPYSVGLLLLKGGEDVELTVETWDPDPTTGERFARVRTDIRHNAGTFLGLGSSGYLELKRWIEEGYQRTGVPDETLVENRGACRSELAKPYGFDPSVAPTGSEAAIYQQFRDEVQPVIRDSCAGGSCHGTPVADLYFTCGDTEEQVRWNYYVALSHVTSPASTSGLLRRPLSQLRGGTFHEGGNVFGSTDDPRYQALRQWAERIETDAPEILLDDDPNPGLRFFANRVQPVLVRKGCMFLNCHSPAMFHDLRLRGGDQGVFSRIATHRNYEMSLLQLAVESPNVNDSRIVAKNLYPPEIVEGGVGIQHRGGSLFEDFGGGGMLNPATPDVCAGVDADNGDLNEIPAYCVLARWHEIEREEAIARGEILPDATPLDAIVYVSRPPGTGDVRDFEPFRPGADLRSAPAMVGADGAVTLGASRSLLDGCPVGPGADIRNPAVSWDGRRIAFAARTAESETYRLYWMNADGSACEPVPGTATPEGVHDFDPAFVPDGRLVFASTRGNVDGNVPYRGPTRTPANLQQNANLFILDADGTVRQETFLLNQEVAPSFMYDGRMIFTAEKRQFEFYQLALRRQNVDGGDYHPLFAQRDSVGFRAATEVVELPNRNLAFVASHLPCHPNLAPEIPCAEDGAGGIATANRSIGPDQSDRDPADRDYLHSLHLIVPGALGPVGTLPSGPLRSGAFRSPAPLPTGRLVVSCDLGATDLRAGPFAYELCELDPSSGQVRTIGGEPGMANVEAVAVYAKPFREVFVSRIDEANAHTEIIPSRSDISQINIADWPLLATLVFANTREGRPIDYRIGGIRAYEVLPPPDSGDFAGMPNVVTDRFGPLHEELSPLGHAPIFPDGSVSIVIPGGIPLVLQPTTADGDEFTFPEGAPFTGTVIQREQMQFYPGEHANQSFKREFFNGLCGTCHGSITGRELDSAVNVDMLTSASRFVARDAVPARLTR